MPFMEEFKTLGIDAVVGSVGNGSTLRLISDIEGVKYTEDVSFRISSRMCSTRTEIRSKKQNITG